MMRVSVQLLFAFLLLLSQAAIASHDVQHIGQEHNEFCAVYVFQDHSSDSGIEVVPVLTTHISPLNEKFDSVDLFITEPSSIYASRAPPYI